MFVDYLRNGTAQTTAVAFSARARPGMEACQCQYQGINCRGSKAPSNGRSGTRRSTRSFRTEDPWSDFGRRRSASRVPWRLSG
ncbi:hypothetical protein ACTMU2_11585 [Cupriavidus basilensis]